MVETTYEIPNAPRLALVADLHGRPYEPVIASLQRHRPQFIAIVGDFIYGSWPEDNKSPLETQENVLPLLYACAAIAPTYLSLGNHEYMLDQADLGLISSTGVTILDNGWTNAFAGGRRLAIGGLTSAYVTSHRALTAHASSGRRYPRKSTPGDSKGAATADSYVPNTKWLGEFASADGYHILLSHHPEYLPLVPKEVQLMLSGHAHGGQWRFYNPFKREWFGCYAPGQGVFPRYTRGVYEGRLVVSAGLANTVRVPRLFNPTEVVYVESQTRA